MPSTKLNLKGEPARVVVPAATPFQKAQAKAEGLWGGRTPVRLAEAEISEFPVLSSHLGL